MTPNGFVATRERMSPTRVAVAAALALLVAGCVGYRLGSTLPRDLKTIHVPTFVNRTSEPLLETDTTAAVIRELQTEGTLRVAAAAESADLLLHVTLISYELEPLRFDRDDTQTGEEYRLRIEADMECIRRATGKTVASGRIHGESTFVPSGGLAASKQNALPAASKDLAYRVVQSIVQAW